MRRSRGATLDTCLLLNASGGKRGRGGFASPWRLMRIELDVVGCDGGGGIGRKLMGWFEMCRCLGLC